VAIINAMPDVRAWYCPTAFWPDFHRVRGPRLMCVPDVFHRDFPLGFARLEPELVMGFQTVERAIRGGSHFVTYSEHTRTRTVVGQYGRAPESVTAVHHAAWDLSGWLDPDVSARRQLLAAALRRRGGEAHAEGFATGAQPYLFYASQFRPNKNLLTLLQAYESLVRRRGVTHKLILTGDPARFAPLATFIRDRRLENDVLCLHGLSMQELASFYSLADLALNPSLSEGGCPFTLTEALSVDTPVVMARIPVTEEVVVNPELREWMLFNPYDWRDAAARIEWAITHRDALLERQREFYARLRQRRWEHVVDDYVAILERIAEGK
jgi:glycosyltransferase involved in cell wall biosynthesis